jgi:DNA processing protein
VVVLGGGIARPYPKEHVPLFGRVLAHGGALVSCVDDTTDPAAPRFHQRNAVLAAATAATIVVEAPEVSGALSTARSARRYGRVLCAVPHAPWDPLGAGGLAEIVAGAEIVRSAADVVRALGAAPLRGRRVTRPRARGKARETLVLMGTSGDETDRALAPGAEMNQKAGLLIETLGDAARAVYDALDVYPLHVDEVCERSGLSVPSVAEALLTLTLHTVVVEGPVGSYRRTQR